MKQLLKTVLAGLIFFALFSPVSAFDRNIQAEISEDTLNMFVDRIGVPSDGGVHQEYNPLPGRGIFKECFNSGYFKCAGPPSLGIPMVLCKKKGGGIASVPMGEPTVWQWWVTDAHFDICRESACSDSMTFTATVITKIGDDINHVTRTVPAEVKFDTISEQLRISIFPYNVLLVGIINGQDGPLATVHVHNLYGISVPLEFPTLNIPKPAGGQNNVEVSIKEAKIDYLSSHKVRLRIDVDY